MLGVSRDGHSKPQTVKQGHLLVADIPMLTQGLSVTVTELFFFFFPIPLL